MKLVKNISVVALATSFMFAGVGFHMSNNYNDMDGTTSVTQSFGVTYDLNDNTSIGWDAELGMMMYFDAPAGVTLRLGWTAGNPFACLDGDIAAECDDLPGVDPLVDEVAAFNAANPDDQLNFSGNPAGTSIGLGYTWWTGGAGFKTSISTNIDYMMKPDASSFIGFEDNMSNLSVVVGFGF